MDLTNYFGKRTFLLLAISIFSVIFSYFVVAVPLLPAEFYGSIYEHGSPAPVGSELLFKYGGVDCQPVFRTSVYGYFGLVTCPVDDPTTSEVEGAVEGSDIEVLYNGLPTAMLGDNATVYSGEFKFLNISFPVPFCGDGTCDIFFETPLVCPEDCYDPNASGNGTGGTGVDWNISVNGSTGSGGNGTETGGGAGGGDTSGGDTGEGGASGGASGGGSGGGSSGGGASSSSTTAGASSTNLIGDGAFGITGLAGFCSESWDCGEWTECSIEGIQTRKCTDMNHCNTYDEKPSEVQECVYIASCFNGIQDGDETGIDCGGSCKPCPGCDNGIQDCQIVDGEQICEDGVDCGGLCRPCDSCFDGVQDWTETGIDCGGRYCTPCALKPILEVPELVCEKSINPLTNGGIWFFLLIIVLVLIRTFFYVKKLDKIHKDHEQDEYKRAKAYFAERRKMVIFIVAALLIALLLYLIFYEFIICELEYGYLWLFGLLTIFVGLIIYFVWHFMEYDDKKKLIKLGALSREHTDQMMKMMDFENKQILSIEVEVKTLIDKMAKDDLLHKKLIEFENLRHIYKSIIQLFFEYKNNKSPYGIEHDLCKQVYDIETNEHFKELASKYPDFWLLYHKLKVLYQHYESKQELYDQIEEERERIKAHLESSGMPEVEENKFEGSSEAEKKKE